MLLIVVCDKGNVLHIVHVLPLVSVACLRLLFMSSIAGPLIPHWDRYRMPFTGGHNTPFSLRHRVGDGGRGYLVTIVIDTRERWIERYLPKVIIHYFTSLLCRNYFAITNR